MDYYSILGPIDPQIKRTKGPGMVPALGYLQQYHRLIEKSKAGLLTTAEATFLIEKFDPAELYAFEQARELSVSLLTEWLQCYKFRNWKVTESRKAPVTKQMRKERAEDIARKLNSTERWCSHARGISMEVLTRELKLKINDFGADKNLAAPIRQYYNLLKDYIARTNQKGVVHVLGHYRAF